MEVCHRNEDCSLTSFTYFIGFVFFLHILIGGVFGVRFHHFFTCPNEADSAVDWSELRAGRVPAPFHLSALTRQTAATNAYDQARDLGFAQPPPPQMPIAEAALQKGEGGKDRLRPLSQQGRGRKDGIPPRPGTRGSLQSRGSLRSRGSLHSQGSMGSLESRGSLGSFGEQGVHGEHGEYDDDSAEYDRPSVNPTAYQPVPYPPPLSAGSNAARIGPSGIDVFAERLRSTTAEAAEEEQGDAAYSILEDGATEEEIVRPSTRERAIPFQFQLASIQAAKTAEHVREEDAAVRYGEAVNRLASLQREKLVEKEENSQRAQERQMMMT